MQPDTASPNAKADKVLMDTSRSSRRSYRILNLGITMAVVLIIFTGVIAIRGLIDRHDAQDIAQLRSIATLKAEQVRRWLDERRMDAEMLQTATLLNKFMFHWLRGEEPNNDNFVLERLGTLKKILGYQSIFVTDSEGKPLFGAGDQHHITATLRTSLERAFDTQQVQFTDVYHESDGEGHLHFDFIVPLVNPENESKLALVLRLDKEDFLFPFLQEWPLVSSSAETLLFKRDEDRVLFLNELHHRNDYALKLRIPMTNTKGLAVQLSKRQKMSEKPVVGVDYRGVPTIGVVYPVQGTSWFLLAKMDREEFDAELHRDLILVSLILLLALLTVVAGAVLLNQRKKLHWATISQRDLAESSLDIVFQAMPDLFFRMAADGTILDYRAQKSSALSVVPEIFLGKRMQDVLPAEVGQQFVAKIAQTLETHQLLSYEYDLPMAQGNCHYEARLVSLNDTQQIIAVVRDITERKQKEQAHIESRKLLEKAQVLAHIGHWKLDPVTMKSVWADEIFHIFGIVYSNEVDLEFLSGLLHPDDRDTVLASLRKVAAQELQFQVEFRIVRPDGETRWVECLGEQVCDKGNELLNVSGFIQDITQRKLDELQLQEQEHQVRDLLESTAESIFGVDLQGNFTFANSACVQTLGYQSFDEMSGREVHQLIHHRRPDGSLFPADECPMHHTLISGKGLHIDTEVLWRADGTSFPIEYWSYPVRRNEKLTGSVVTFLDITERKSMEERLRKLAQAVEQSPESIVITNLDVEIEYVNEAFIRTSGYSLEEVVGQNLQELHSGKTPLDTYQDMWHTLSHGKPWQGEFYNKNKAGTEYIEFAHVAPIRQPDGTITHFLAVKEDITEKKQLAQELEQHRHHLEEQVTRRTRQLAEAREQAENANLAKSDFLANMSHEIRTPMNAIVGLTQLLRRAGLTSEQAKRLSKIDIAARHLLSIINDILDISKIEAGKLTLEESDFDLNSIFDHIQSLLREQANVKGLTLEVAENLLPRWFKGDPTRLCQALLNYANNAVKFTEQGSIFLRARKVDEQGDAILVRFEVQDTGIGIDSDKLPDLFKAFEQADVSTTRHYGGTGLGLAITRRLAQLMGGEAGVESEMGRGSTFWFTARLGRGQPVLSDATSATVSDAEMELRNSYSGVRILLVEDNAINREVAQELLSSVGLSVDTAENGKEALAKIRNETYNLILMDIQMPVMDGLEATRMIRSMAELADLPILAMTANIFEEDRQACLEAGMNDFVAKPIDLENLFSTIVNWLSNTSSISSNLINKPIVSDAKTLTSESSNNPINLMALTALFGDDMDKKLIFLKKFIPQAEKIVTEIIIACDKLDSEQVSLLAHKLKSSARTMGADTLADLCQALEVAGRDIDWPAIDRLYPELLPKMQRVTNFINGL